MTDCNKVLIVDDDKDDQNFLSEVIQELFPHLKCSTVDNGEEVLNYIQNDSASKAYFIGFKHAGLKRL